jgi:transcriptional regulator with XRE-family HTH domain
MRKPKTFGQYVKTIREQRGMSGRQLAKQAKVANTTIMDIEKGSTPQPELFVSLIDTLELNAITAVKLLEPYRNIYERIITALEVKWWQPVRMVAGL